MSDIRIYFINLFALAFSFIDNIEPVLQTAVLILSIIYTTIGIYKQLKK